MKKWIAFMLVLFLGFVVVGCGPKDNPDDPDNPSKDTVKPTEIVISGEQSEIAVGEEFTITVEVKPDNATNKNVRITSNPSGIVTITDKTIKGTAPGETEVTVTAVGDTKVTKTFKVTVTGEAAKEIAPTSLTINASKKEVSVGLSLLLTVTAAPENASKSVTWETSNPQIATVTASGSVVGVAEGNVTITATSKLDENVKATIDLKVVPKQDIEVPDVDPESIEIVFSDTEVELGYSITFQVTVYPAGALQDYEITVVSGAENIEISNGRIKGAKVGSAAIRATTPDGKVKTSLKQIKVIPNPVPDPYPNMGGYCITVMNAAGSEAEYDPFNEGYKVADKEFKQQALTEMKQNFNCDYKVIAYPDGAPWGSQRYEWINNQAKNGDAQADFYVVASNWISHFGAGQSVTDGLSFYQRYGKNQMDPITKTSAMYKGQLVTVPIPSDPSKNYADLGFYYNVGMLEKLGLESPAKMFNEDRWHYADFIEWAKGAQAVIGDGNVAISGNLYYMFIGMSSAAGVTIADVNTAKVTLTSDAQKRIAQVLQELAAAGALSTASEWMESTGEFIEGKSLMTSGSWWFVKTSNRWSTTMFGDDTRYGYVPFPYPDSMSKDSARTGTYETTILLFANAREKAHGSNVSYQDVYRAMTEYYLNANKYYTNSENYDPESIKRAAIESRIDDPESVEAAMWWTADKVIFDSVQNFTYISPDGSPLNGAITRTVKGADFEAEMDAVFEKYNNEFQAYAAK